MKDKRSLVFALFFGASVSIFAQVPVIQNVEPLNAHPNDTILITGSGFSTSAANMDVWFDQVKGTVISSSEFAIEVRVPAQAKLNTIEVINRTSFLSTKSDLKFLPSFSGEPFDIAKINTTLTEGVNKFSAAEELWDLSTSDLNLDGKPDIVATKFQSPGAFFGPSTDIIILQNSSTPGNLSFNRLEKNNLAVLNLTFPTDNVVTGDLQGDGKPEIVVSRGGSTRNSIHIFRNTSPAGGAINFAPNITLTLETGHVATRMTLKDLNKDGKPEITVSNSFNDIVYIFVNQSSGGTLSFNTTPIKLSVKAFASDASSTNYEVEIQDFNSDDLPDLIVNEFQEDSLHIFRNTSAGTISFAPRVSMPTAEKLNRISSADINNDGKPDLLATSTLNNVLLVFLNQSTASPILFASPIVLATSTGAWGLDVGDIDGDHDPDIINANRNQNAIDIFLHNGNFNSPGFTRQDITTANPTRNVKVADMDGDGKPEVIYTSFNTDSPPHTSTLEILRNANCHKPKILNEQPLAVCNGRTVKLETYAVANVTYSWKKDNIDVGTNSPFLTISAPGNAAGTYTVTATGEGGACTITSSSITVTENSGAAPANPDLTANTPLCTASQLQLGTSVTADIYAWTGPNNFSSSLQNPVVNAVTQDHAGLYFLQVTVAGCKSNVVSKRVDVADMADFAISSNNPTNTICQGGNLILSVSNLANHTYQWKKNGTNIATGGGTSTLTVTEEGSYSADITNITLNCNTEVGPVSVVVLQSPVAAYQVDASACTGEEIIFTNQSTVDSRATVVYNWNFGDTNSSQDTNPAKTYSTAQSFNTSLTVTYTGVTGCSNNTAKPVVVTASIQPDINSTATSLCPDGAATLSFSQSTFTTILWSNGATANSITVTGPGTYSVATTDQNGCPGQDEFIVNALPVPEVFATADPSTIPLGASANLLATGADTYTWQPAETLNDPAIANPVATPTTTTTYTVTGKNADNCTNQMQVTVTIQGVLGFPITFSPNGDGQFDEWDIHAPDKPDCTLSIFDTRGRRVFESKGLNWDGSYEGKSVPAGTYYYVFGCPSEKPITGNVLVIR